VPPYFIISWRNDLLSRLWHLLFLSAYVFLHVDFFKLSFLILVQLTLILYLFHFLSICGINHTLLGGILFSKHLFLTFQIGPLTLTHLLPHLLSFASLFLPQMLFLLLKPFVVLFNFLLLLKPLSPLEVSSSVNFLSNSFKLSFLVFFGRRYFIGDMVSNEVIIS